jgi:outer membrane lipoprotein-sorting protein
MKTRAFVIYTALAGTFFVHRDVILAAPPEGSSARQLITPVLEANRTSGLRVRSKLIVTTSNPEHREVKQLLIKGRTDGKTTRTLYQILWPAHAKGQSLLIEKSEHSVSGFLFEPPDAIKKLSSSLMAQPFFESDLSIEDLAEDFWDWPSQKIVGQERVKEKLCTIVESKPPEDASTSYTLVKTWIAPELALPLRIEKYGKNHRLVRRLSADRVMKVHDRWTAATIIVDLSGSNSRTILEGSKSERDLDLPASELTIEAIKREGAAAATSGLN